MGVYKNFGRLSPMVLIRFKQVLSGGIRCVSKESSGQSTVEYALLVFAFLAMVLAVGALWKLGAQGKLAELSASAASHIFGTAEGLRDMLLF